MVEQLNLINCILSAIKKDMTLATTEEELIAAVEHNRANLLMAEKILTKLLEE